MCVLIKILFFVKRRMHLQTNKHKLSISSLNTVMPTGHSNHTLSVHVHAWVLTTCRDWTIRYIAIAWSVKFTSLVVITVCVCVGGGGVILYQFEVRETAFTRNNSHGNGLKYSEGDRIVWEGSIYLLLLERYFKIPRGCFVVSGKRLFNETISSVNTRPHTLVDWSADEVKACSLFYLDVIQVIKFIEHIE